MVGLSECPMILPKEGRSFAKTCLLEMRRNRLGYEKEPVFEKESTVDIRTSPEFRTGFGSSVWAMGSPSSTLGCLLTDAYYAQHPLKPCPESLAKEWEKRKPRLPIDEASR